MISCSRLGCVRCHLLQVACLLYYLEKSAPGLKCAYALLQAFFKAQHLFQKVHLLYLRIQSELQITYNSIIKNAKVYWF